VSSDFPSSPQIPQSESWPAVYSDTTSPPISTKPTLREWLISLGLFLATLLSTTFAGLVYNSGSQDFSLNFRVVMAHPEWLKNGLFFSVPFLGILLAHEFGHFFACRYYGIRCTPPFFIPIPITIAGTLGAFIRIKAPFQNKRALFDVGMAGPLAGFAVIIPTLVVGIARSELILKRPMPGALYFGEPLIFRWIGQMVIGYSPATQDMNADPIAMAAWFGLLATCLNLFPIWQLDGGHIAFAILGKFWHKRISITALATLMLVSFLGWPVPSYLAFAILLLIFGMRFRFVHPPVLYDQEKLGTGRILLAILALIILLISFTPVPISV
jgi:membrane-associated protease RseP (regulator of RpoE activity)